MEDKNNFVPSLPTVIARFNVLYLTPQELDEKDKDYLDKVTLAPFKKETHIA